MSLLWNRCVGRYNDNSWCTGNTNTSVSLTFNIVHMVSQPSKSKYSWLSWSDCINRKPARNINKSYILIVHITCCFSIDPNDRNLCKKRVASCLLSKHTATLSMISKSILDDTSSVEHCICDLYDRWKYSTQLIYVTR